MIKNSGRKLYVFVATDKFGGAWVPKTKTTGAKGDKMGTRVSSKMFAQC